MAKTIALFTFVTLLANFASADMVCGMVMSSDDIVRAKEASEVKTPQQLIKMVKESGGDARQCKHEGKTVVAVRYFDGQSAAFVF